MARKNHFKMVCQDCGHEFIMPKLALSRRCKPRCNECGSTVLLFKTEEATERAYDHEEAVLEVKDRRAKLMRGV